MELEKATLLKLYEKMLTIRTFENNAAELFAAGKIPGFVHLYVGEEAIATGVCANLNNGDFITSTHRGHGHLIAKGGDVTLMMAELFAKKTGYCKGKGGSMHIADVELGILGANGIVGAGLPIATGAAFACKYKGNDNVAVCFFGDGASNRGTFHESLNMASVWNLPIIFINENNMYGISCHQKDSMKIRDVADRAAGYAIPGICIDGNDVVAVYEAANEAVKRARNGEGPTLIECKTWRHRGHFEGDPSVYRIEELHEEWLKKDPLPRFKEKLLHLKIASNSELEKIQASVNEKIAEAIKFAEDSPAPSPEDVLTDVYA